MFKLELETGNDEFGETAGERCQAVAEILRTVAARLESGEPAGRIRDANGNTVGAYSLTREG